MRNIPHKVTGDTLTADEFNDIPSEEENLITSSGQALSAGDLYQIAKAVSMYSAVGDFYVDSGTANNYILTAVSPLQAPTQYMDGFRARFRISHTNTGASTVNVNSLGVKSIVKEDGHTPLGDGDLPAGEHGEIIFHTDLNVFELYSHKYQDNIFSTGDIIFSSIPNAKAGWISYYNVCTIGDASSGATLRANADCENLYKFWWTNYSDAICPVTGGRGVSAAADWAAHKPMGTVPYYKYYTMCATSNYYPSRGLGAMLGQETHILSSAEMAHHRHDPAAILNSPSDECLGDANNGWSGGGGGAFGPGFFANSFKTEYSGTSTAHNNIQPSIFQTLHVKL